ncbi:cysteine--tRNA ligase [Candidatus Azoamicus ciliaticola]|uniref:Cysteine--tRNA ligase n=1 Tax=Candidatus Azoamicus ciliaticola TaxID=2652803 RepID=A0A6J5JZ23_9GAMM|nr:cysteine--tRNA ligase [Candidatus Azoamicus ciliaticola]CAB3976359.1 Cysteine--tRNA ligase [Candidatus Azoamicus ciliaticola]
MIKIYNTLNKKNESIKNNIIKIYTCGITVYDNCHIGHARLFLLFDSLIRYLNTSNKKIIFIRNITDIDDKIIKKAKEKNIHIKTLTEKFIKSMHDDTKKLNIIEPTYEPKATSFIKEMIELIKIIKKKYTYKNKQSAIYFEVNKLNNYGMLSNQKNKSIKQSYQNNKKNKNDFVLWKNFKKKEKIYWQTPWGKGRPGWHTECAAMTMYYSKDYIDIHGGGQDLLFPHHENELAQCIASGKKDFIKIWMHVGQLKIEKKKMSKKLGNQILIKDLLKNYNEEYLRFLILSTNYKKSINFNYETLKKMKITLDKLYKIKENLKNKKFNINPEINKAFDDALQNNFNTQKAIAILFKKLKEKNDIEIKYSTIELLKKIGLLKYETLKIKKLNIENIETLIAQRNEARKNKNWSLADKIRQKLIKFNIKIKDQKDNTTIFEPD